ncbi:MAG: isoprenylcysteine carboxylmethyltransferase family protein [Phycisphaerae bacterium]
MTPPGPSTARIAALWAFFLLIWAGCLFGSAGRLDLPFFWAYLGLLIAMLVIAVRIMDRELLRERFAPAPGGHDRHLRWIALPILASELVIAGLDVGRFGWSRPLPPGLRIAALGVVAASLAFAIWALRVNRFFSPVVRIQSERGHHLVTGGPYRFVRHPGYASAVLGWPAGAIALGSWWALLPLLVLAVLLVRRTALEDRYLREQLPGYAEYAARVRYRIVPGVW